MKSDEHYKRAVKGARPVPYFGSDWTWKMEYWLKSKRGLFDGPCEWLEWICDNAEAICRSWGDTGKATRPEGLMLKLLDELDDRIDDPGGLAANRQEYARRITEAVDKWSGKHWEGV